MFAGECAPTLAPWKPVHEATTSEAMSSPNDKHIYGINDIVHFEDNDIVMRDAKVKFHDNNKLDNSVDPLNEIQKLNMAGFKNTVKLTDDYSNHIDPVKEIQKLNMADDLNGSNFKNDASMNEVIDTKKQNNAGVQIGVDLNRDTSNVMSGGSVDLKNDKEVDCDCQHGGGCVNHGCLCPLGYAGDKCEITLDLKVNIFLKPSINKFFKNLTAKDYTTSITL